MRKWHKVQQKHQTQTHKERDLVLPKRLIHCLSYRKVVQKGPEKRNWDKSCKISWVFTRRNISAGEKVQTEIYWRVQRKEQRQKLTHHCTSSQLFRGFLASFRSLFWFHSPHTPLSSASFLAEAGSCFRLKISDKPSVLYLPSTKQAELETSWWTKWSI